MKTHLEVLITDIPDRFIDLESPNFLCSSAGKFDQERLDFFAKSIFPYWHDNQCSLHRLSDYLNSFDIEMWTAPDVGKATNSNNEFCFWLRFNKKYPGEILVQCEILSQSKVH